MHNISTLATELTKVYLTAEPRAGDIVILLFRYEPIITKDKGP